MTLEDAAAMAVAVPEEAGAADEYEACEHARRMMAALGFPLHEPGMVGTPARLVNALRELTGGLREDPGRHLEVTFPPESNDPGLIAVTNVPFISLCEHHLLPFTGAMTVAYVPAPGAPIVGLSKLARMAQGFAAMPQVQEHLGEQIAETLHTKLESLKGVFRTEPAMRENFFRLHSSGV
ncbi:GTP cyclohydrolase I type 1 [[Actinomadura] parvosata subsp. kistnae]|uniref:GTP cyclohydrolase 1 n=1 Tax=[Actinomadura] parvosata subsp. kistnae TaxID=1909395 RepID=A0A1U9ZWN3_9ACTN|nr:GTP cyclohydrolase I [Nonomuraea sp. ATCC 55076]AQZ62363.1 hypothetical protein BKM31_13610 [Nonomuraea sp. ATCC 55076]SPL88565.1 GTP cyclohydrolase I type 1 [Actinomadura parvosata subsp. kistnae]